MSEENNVTQTTEDTQDKNNSTQADTKNVPYDRFTEVNTAKNDALNQIGKLQAQIDKMNQTSKQQQEANDINTKQRDSYKVKSDEWDQYQSNKRETLMNQLTDDDDKSIADGLSLDKLEKYVTKVSNISTPSTSKARATTGTAGEMGGYSSWEEFAIKDPINAEKALQNTGLKKF